MTNTHFRARAIAAVAAVAAITLVAFAPVPALARTTGPGASTASGGGGSASDDDAAVRRLVRQLQDGWNAHDGKAFAAPFAPDADYVVVNGLKLKGREEIERGHAHIFATVYRQSRNTGTVVDARFLRPDVAVVHVEWTLEVGEPAGGPRQHRAMSTMVMTKEANAWTIAAFQNTPIQESGR